jgi:branched-chain amino acid transport system substrate-binding protein
MIKTTLNKTLIFTLTVLLTACGSNSSQTNNSQTNTPQNNTNSNNSNSNEIPIGLAVALTSNVSLLGQDQKDGAAIAEKYFNDQGGIDQTKIKLITQDTGGDEAGAINAFQTLINQNKVVGIVGPTLSQQAFSADPIAERAKVPVLGPSNTAKGIPQIGEYIGRVSAPIAIVAPQAISAALKINPQIKKVALLFAQNDAFTKSESEIFEKTIKEQKLDLVTVQKFQTTDTDFQSQATNTLNLKPDLIVISGLASDGGNLVRQLKELGYKGLIVGGNGFNTSKIFPVCKALCDGILVAQAYTPTYANDINKSFREAYLQQFKKEPSQVTAQSFTGVQVYVEALRSLNKKTKISTLSLSQLRTELNKELLAGKYTTPLGDISFTPEGEIIQKEFYVAQIKMDKDGVNGKFDFLK